MITFTKDTLMDVIPEGADIIIPPGNGEPHRLLDWLEAGNEQLNHVSIHQILPLRQREYMKQVYGTRLRHISYFLSDANRQAFHEQQVELVPNHFHEMPKILKQSTRLSMIMTVVSPMDEHGYFSLGTQSDYISEFVGKVPFVVEVNRHMPRTVGRNQIHYTQVLGMVEHHQPLLQLKNGRISDKDQKIAEQIAERVNNGDTIQVGIGSIPDAVTRLLKDHKKLGIHTELLTEGIVDLVESGAVDGTEKYTHVNKIIGTFALGTDRLYKFMNNNPLVELLPVSQVNHPCEIAKEERIVSINATTEVDLYGQCASETIAGRYYSSTGGQADFSRAVHFAKEGKGFICLHSTAKNDEISRIVAHLSTGSVVSTSKNDVDHIVTEYGIARLYGRSLSARAEALIGIAHPKFRERLLYESKKAGIYI